MRCSICCEKAGKNFEYLFPAAYDAARSYLTCDSLDVTLELGEYVLEVSFNSQQYAAFEDFTFPRIIAQGPVLSMDYGVIQILESEEALNVSVSVLDMKGVPSARAIDVQVDVGKTTGELADIYSSVNIEQDLSVASEALRWEVGDLTQKFFIVPFVCGIGDCGELHGVPAPVLRAPQARRTS